VLATNVIELRLKYAKVAPLPNPQQHSPQQPSPQQHGPQQHSLQQPSPQPRTALRPQSLEPLPPRPDRRTPSGDRRYGGI
jgi:hypothetical protein